MSVQVFAIFGRRQEIFFTAQNERWLLDFMESGDDIKSVTGRQITVESGVTGDLFLNDLLWEGSAVGFSHGQLRGLEPGLLWLLPRPFKQRGEHTQARSGADQN